MAKGGKRVLGIIAENSNPDFKKACASLHPDELQVEVVRLDSFFDAIRLVQTPRQYLLLYHLENRSDLSDLVVFTQMIGVHLRRGNVALAVVNATKDRSTSMAIDLLGCVEWDYFRVINPIYMKAAVSAQLHSMGRFYFRSDELGTQVRLVPRREELEQSYWLLRSTTDIRKVGDFWVIDLLGPPPKIGKWQAAGVATTAAAQPDPEDDAVAWEWHPSNSPLASIFSEPGISWVFRGRKPRFVACHWTFIGKNPILSMTRKGIQPCPYFALTEEGTLAVADNPREGMAKWKRIYDALTETEEYKMAVEHYTTDRTAIVIGADPAAAVRLRASSETDTGGKAADWNDFIRTKAENWKATVTQSRSEDADPEVLKSLVTDALQPKTEKFQKTEGKLHGTFLRELDRGSHRTSLLIKGSNLAVLGWSAGCDRLYQNLNVKIDSSTNPISSPEALLKACSDSTTILVNVGVKRAFLFFAILASQLKVTPEGMTIPLPAWFYRLQRRNCSRYVLPKDEPVMATLEPTGERLRIIDISASGVKLEFDGVDETMTARFAKGTTGLRLSFKLWGATYTAACDIKWLKVTHADLTTRMGLQFTNLTPVQTETINLHVLEHSFEFLESLSRS